MEPYLKKAVEEVRKRHAKKVALQIPEGLKTALPGIIEAIEAGGTEAFAFVEPCFGACDVKDREAECLGAELLIHFGHSRFVQKHCIETVYIPVVYGADSGKVSLLASKLEKMLGGKGIKKVGLCSTVQYGPQLALLKELLEKKGFGAFFGKGKCLEKGQVLGCNYGSAKAVGNKIEAFVFLGDGLFHPVGLGLAAKKPVFAADPIQGEVKEIGVERELFVRKRIAMIEGARQAKAVAIWVSTKRGQERMQEALALKRKFEERGKRAFVFASDLLSSDYIAGIDIGAVVCTACPRIAIDDSSSFRQQVITAGEALIVLGEKKIEEYGGICFG